MFANHEYRLQGLENWGTQVEPWKISAEGRIKELEDWKTKTEPWGGRIDGLEKWKSTTDQWKASTDTALKNLDTSQKKIFTWQTEVNKWKNDTDGQLAKLDQEKLGVNDYKTQQGQRDKQIADITGLLASHIPHVRERIETEGGVGQWGIGGGNIGANTDIRC